MTVTHALLPIAVAVAVGPRRDRWVIVLTAAAAAAAPDIDGVWKHFLQLPIYSPYAHRGAAHSLFAAIVAGFVAALFHRRIGVQPLTAGVVVTAAMASHGVLDMMTDRGLPVAYLWPLSSARLFADWRPIHSIPIHLHHSFFSDTVARCSSELMQLIIPMFAVALAIRVARSTWSRLGPAKV